MRWDTPRVVRTDPEIREVGRELRERLQGLHGLETARPAAPQEEGAAR